MLLAAPASCMFDCNQCSTTLPNIYTVFGNHLSCISKHVERHPPACRIYTFMPLTAGIDVWGYDESPYNGSERARVQRLGRPPSSKGAILQASTWFDDVAAPRMHQMHKAQKDAVRGHDQELDKKVQQLTQSLCQVSHLSCHPVYVFYHPVERFLLSAPMAGLLLSHNNFITFI